MSNENMDPAAGFNNIFTGWIDSQQQLWKTCLNVATDRSDTPWESFYKQPVAASETMVDYALKTQSEWAHTCIKNMVNGNGETKLTSQWVEEMEALVDGWTEARRKAWDTWFTAAKQQSPLTSVQGATDAVGAWWQTYTDTTSKMLETQTALANSLLSGGPETKAEQHSAVAKKPARAA